MEYPPAVDGRSSPAHDSLARAWRLPGHWLMAFGGMLISGGFVVICLGLLFKVIENLSPLSILLIPVLVAGMGVSGWHIGATIVSMLRPQLAPAIQVALMQPNWAARLRYPIAGWWLMHLSLGALLSISALLEHDVDWRFVAILSVVSTVFTYAAHGFLMLVVTCFTKHIDWIVRIWQWRIVIAICHGLAVLVVGIGRLFEG